MAKKKQKAYTVDELVALKVRLLKHRAALRERLGLRLAELDKHLQAEADASVIPARNSCFDSACDVRDSAGLLTTICLCLSHFPVLLKLVSLTGKPETVPYLDECGLEDESTEEAR